MLRIRWFIFTIHSAVSSDSQSDSPRTPATGPGEQVSRTRTPAGRTIRVVVIALVGLGVVIFGKFWYLQHQREGRASRTGTGLPAASERPATEIPEARFTDVTTASGIQFVHNNGA